MISSESPIIPLVGSLQFNRISKANTKTGTGAILARAADEPSIEFSRMLIRRSRQNLVCRTSAFSSSPWVTANPPTITADAATAPDGTTTADSIAWATQALSRVMQAVTVADNAAVTVQVWARAAAANVFRFQMRSKTNVQTSSPDIAIGTEWALYSYTFSDVDSGGTQVQFGLANQAAGGVNTSFFAEYSAFVNRYPLSGVTNTTNNQSSAITTDLEDVAMLLPGQVPLTVREGSCGRIIVPQWGTADLVSGDTRILCSFGGPDDYIAFRHDGADVICEVVAGGAQQVATTALTIAREAVTSFRADAAAGTISVGGVSVSGTPWTFPSGFMRDGGIVGVLGNEFDGALGVITR